MSDNDSVQPVSSSPPPPQPDVSSSSSSSGSNFMSSVRHDLVGGGPSSTPPSGSSSSSPEGKSAQRNDVANQAEQVQKANQIPGHPDVGANANSGQCPFCQSAGKAGQS